MHLRIISIIASISVFGLPGLARASNETPASSTVETGVAPIEAGMSAYRQYVKEQADALVGMTRVLAREIKDGNLQAAQMAYAPAHRYYKRIEPMVRLLPDLRHRVDAHANDFEMREADPGFSGFHRIEYGLFANGSTAGLSDYADRLDKDARDLRARLAFVANTPGRLIDATVETLAENGLAGGEERYSKTDLWDLEASIDSARQVAELHRAGQEPDAQNSTASATIHFGALDAMLEKSKVGCGFKNYDELSRDERTALTVATRTLAAEVWALRTRLPPADALHAGTP